MPTSFVGILASSLSLLITHIKAAGNGSSIECLTALGEIRTEFQAPGFRIWEVKHKIRYLFLGSVQ